MTAHFPGLAQTLKSAAGKLVFWTKTFSFSEMMRLVTCFAKEGKHHGWVFLVTTNPSYDSTHMPTF